MQAATVELLVTKAKFDPNTAVAIAEAIDMALSNSQLVTVQVMDSRFAELRAEMLSIKAELVRWIFIVMLGNVALTAGITAILNAVQR